ncbi:MAG: hypothetical protein A2033_00960 [Bacteroidetes bacterium GWA2_31_9]|nr:MAG: hypothetical protein A2033_00960 [Bacteroidetes bacterium GWA2_31_9]
MKLIIETTNFNEFEKILYFFKTIEIGSVKVISEHIIPTPKIHKGNKKINPKELFGIWKDNPKSLEQIRENSWKRNWIL